MEIIHRVSVNSTREIRRELAASGISVEPEGFVTFTVRESDRVWRQIGEWVSRRGALDVVETTFSPKEIEAADWLELQPERHHGYPQPEADFGFREATYDLDDYCVHCGIGARQRAPFHMKGEPKWGRGTMLQLNWVFDEFFATPRVWDEVFRPYGIEGRTVLNRKRAELQTVVQLAASGSVDVATGGLPVDSCPACRRAKHAPIRRGPFPPVEGEMSGHYVKTRQYFGSGGRAWKGVLVSGVVARALLAAGVRGVSLRPAADPARFGL
jgi:hypothetical protein